MTYFVLFQLALLSFVMVNGSLRSNTTTEIQDKFDKLMPTINTLPGTGVESIMFSSNGRICSVANQALTHFVLHAMANYTTWLGNGDNLKPDPSEILLSFSKTDLYLSNQYMSNYPSEGNVVEVITSDTSILIMRANWLDDSGVAIGGDYNVTGSFNVSSALEIQFSGKGQFTLKGAQIRDDLRYNSYSFDKDGYLDLSSSSSEYWHMSDVSDVEFEGLQFDYVGEVDESWMPNLKQYLATRYLRSGFWPESMYQEHYPPSRLLKKYFQEISSSIQLEGIADCDVVPDKGGNILASGWVILVTLAASFYY